MYYNNKFKILNIILSIVTIFTAIFSIANLNLKIVMPSMLILLALQQLLIGINYLKLNKKKEYILSIGGSIFVFVCSIVSIILIFS